MTTTRSAFSAAIAPIIGRLPGIAIAAAAKHHHKAAGHIRPQRIERLGKRIRLVGIIDEDRRAVFLSDEIEPALGALELRQRAEPPAGSLPVAMASPAATSAFSTWKAPGSGSRTL